MSKAQKKIDLDAFLNESLGTGTVITLYGKDWHLKPEIPALLMLRLRNELEGDDSELTFEQELDLLRALMANPDAVDELLAAGMGNSAFTALIRIALASYSGIDPKQVLELMEAEKQAEANGEESVNQGKAVKKTPSSRTGRGSKQTSVQPTE
jgi:hypothetical protein